MAFAAPEALGNTGVTWEISGTTLTIGYTGEGSGVMPTYSSSTDATRPWFSSRASITDIIVEEGITVIGAYAFHGCTAATTVSLPSTIDSIGYNVFQSLPTSCATTYHGTLEQWCNVGLRNYDSNPFSKGDKKLRTSEGEITKLNIPKGLTKIKPYTFYGLNITEVTIPTSVTIIGGYAFRNCSSLSSVTFTATSKVDSIATYAFGSTGLTAITIPSSVRVIETRAFDACASLKTIDFNNATKLKTIGTYAFYGTTALTTLSLRGATSLVTIGNSAFSAGSSANATAKSYLYLPASLRTIEANAFNNRTGLEAIVIMNTNTIDANLTKCSTTTCFPAALSGIPVYVNSAAIQTTYSGLTEWSTFTNFTSTNTVTFDCGTPTASSLVASLNIRTGSLTFTGSGDMKDYTSTKADWKLDVYKSVLKSVTISKMSRIGAYAFYNCDNLTGSISIPNTVVSIGNRAFCGCKGLTGLTLSSASKLETIDQYAFYGCSGITSSISATSWGGKVSTLGNYAFSGCGFTKVTPPSTLTSLGNYAFQGNKSLQTADFSASTGLTTFGTWMFAGCSALNNVILPPNLTAIPDRTFSACSSLKTVSIPASVESVSYLTFASSGIKTIIANRATPPTLSATMNSIRPDTVRLAVFTSAAKTAYKAHTYWGQFDVDTKVEGTCGAEGDNMTYALDLAIGVLTISGSGNMDTYNTSTNRAPWYGYRSLISSVIVEDGVEGIGAYAFKECASMTTISLPASIKSMASSVFDGCSGLSSYSYAGGVNDWVAIRFTSTSSNPMYYVRKCFANDSDDEITELVIPNGVTTIGQYAFYQCSGLTAVTLPASLKSVGSSAFSTCTNIASVNYLGTINDWCWISFAGNVANPAFFSKKLSINEVEQTDIYLADTLTKINDYAFYDNRALESISIKNTTTINANALTDCPADITIRGKLSGSCGDNATWSLEDGVLTISGTGPMTSYSLSVNVPWYGIRTAINKLIVEEDITKVGKYALQNATNLIGAYLPNSITSLDDYVFNGCTSLAYIVSAATTPPTIPAHSTGYSSYESGTFTNVLTTALIYVPSGSESAYATASTDPSYASSTGWRRFTTICPYGTCGATGNEENVTWAFNPTAGSLTISGTGAMADYASASAMPWNSFKTSITSIVIEDDVTTIGQRAFYGCTALTSVTFPETFSAIGNYAFYNCSGLTSIALPEGITAIGNSAFYGCTSLASVTLPSTLTSIGSNAFINDALTSIIIPSSVTSIGSGAFKGNAALVSVGLAEAPQLTTIGNSAFENCSSLTSITIPNKVTSIGNSSFSGCSLLAAVNYGDTPTLATIGYSAFKNCSSLTSITIPESVTTITGNSNQNVYTPFAGCTSLTTVIWNARNCSGWTPINYMSSTYYQMPFESIKTQITSFTFGSNVQSIPQYLCHGMTGLTDITIPASVTAIGANAFDGCTNITTVTSNATSVPSIASSTFPSSVEDAATLYVPSTVASRTAYSNDTYWSAFDHMLPYLLTFNLQEHGDAIDPICVNAGRVDEILKPADPTETGYTFGGWYSNEGCTTPFTFGESGTVVNGDLTLYALWTINSYGVTFDLQGHGDPIAPQSINYNGLVSEPSAPSEDYYTFGGWFKEAGCSNAWDFGEDKVTDDLILYAKWTLKGLALNENADNSSAISAYDGLTTDVSMIRSLTNVQYNTFCLPFSLSAEVMTEKFGAGYDLEELTGVAYNAGELTLEFTKRDELEAGKPYLLQPVNIVENPSFAEVTISNAAPSDGLNNAYLAFHGIYSPTELEGGNHNLLFLGAGNELFWPATTGSMKGFRGYFEIKSPALAAVRARIVKKEDAATGIEEVRSENANAVRSEKILRSGQLFIIREGKTYNAQGMLVE